MDTTKRLTLKAVTWQVSGFIVMMLISLIITGSVTASGGIAVAGSAAGFVSYFCHELIWSKVSWGRNAD